MHQPVAYAFEASSKLSLLTISAISSSNITPIEVETPSLNVCASFCTLQWNAQRV